MLCLVLECGDDVRRLSIPREDAVLGSSSSSDIVAPFPGVSRRHARLRLLDGEHVLEDLGSKNGIVVGGRKVDRVHLVQGVPVLLGRATLSLVDGSTSDLEVALAADVGDARSESSHGDTASSGGSDPALGGVLRLLREVDRLGPNATPEERGAILRSARRALGCDTLAVFEIAEDGEPGLAELEGVLPGEDATRRLAAQARRARRRALAANVDAVPALLFAVYRSGRTRLLVALWAAGRPEPEPWQAELVEYLGGKLLLPRGRIARDGAAEEPDRDRLVFPSGFVHGESRAMQGLLSQIRATVRSGMDVLLTGETGTGKELIARMIHDSGPSAGGPFVPINCAAIPSELLESELFGVQGRVATGVDPRPGLFAAADGGSIFLDEVGELAQPLQAKLLRVLQSREVLAVGATTAKKVDVRVISASNRDLLKAVQAGQFRADLFYRLRGLQFHVPPLRDRKEDIPALATAFVNRASREYGKRVKGVSRKALDLLVAYGWPGNVRELESELKRAVLVCPEGGVVGAEHLAGVRWAVERAAAPPAAAEAPSVDAPPQPSSGENLNLREQVDRIERRLIDEALAKSRGNKSLAAKLLGITRNGLGLKLRRLGRGQDPG